MFAAGSRVRGVACRRDGIATAFGARFQELRGEAEESKSEAEALALMHKRHPAIELLPRMSQLAERYREKHIVLPAWNVMCQMVDGTCPESCNETFRQAAERIFEPFRDDERLMQSLLSLRRSRLPAAQAFLKRMGTESLKPRVSACARFALAVSIRRSSQDQQRSEALQILEELDRDYGTIEVSGIDRPAKGRRSDCIIEAASPADRTLVGIGNGTASKSLNRL